MSNLAIGEVQPHQVQAQNPHSLRVDDARAKIVLVKSSK